MIYFWQYFWSNKIKNVLIIEGSCRLGEFIPKFSINSINRLYLLILQIQKHVCIDSKSVLYALKRDMLIFHNMFNMNISFRFSSEEFKHLLNRTSGLFHIAVNLHGIHEGLVISGTSLYSLYALRVVLILMPLNQPWFLIVSLINSQSDKIISLPVIFLIAIHEWIPWLELIHFKLYSILLARQ